MLRVARDAGREKEEQDHLSVLQSEVMKLDVHQRRDLAFQLAWSLPRNEVVLLSERLSRTLQKDILAALPHEIAVLIVGKLPLEDVLACTLVSRTWARLCQSKELWCHLCENHQPPIRPAPTTWSDLRTARSILSGKSPASGKSSLRDEGGMDDSDEAESVDVLSAQGGMGGGGGLDPLPIPVSSIPAVRRSVWERSGGNLLPHRILRKVRPRTTDLEMESPALIPSDMGIPEAFPMVNYKHLFIVHHKLSNRMRNPHISLPFHVESPHDARSIRPQTLDAISSIEAGGLPGHSEIIYALELVRHRMSITMDTSGTSGGLPDTHPLHLLDSLMDANALPTTRPMHQHQHRTVSGRNWLISGSRDRTLRLWALDLTKPKVVKVFHGGHEGSVLTIFATTLPVSPDSGDDAMIGDRGPTEEAERLVIISGGSDGRICLWNVLGNDTRPEKIINAHVDSVLCVRGNQKHLVSCSKDETIRLFSMETFEELLVIPIGASTDHARAAVNAVGLSNNYIVSGSGDKTLRVWDIHTGACLARVEAHSRGIASIFFEPSLPSHIPFQARFPKMGARHRGTIITSSSDASIKMFNVVSYPTDPTSEDKVSFEEMIEEEQDVNEQESLDDEAEHRKICIEPFRTCWAPCTCPPGLGRLDGMRRCGRCLNRGHMELVRSVWLTKDVIISGSYDGSVRTWDGTTGRVLADLSGGHTGRVFSMVGDKCRVISSGLDCRITLWDFGQGLDTAFVET